MISFNKLFCCYQTNEQIFIDCQQPPLLIESEKAALKENAAIKIQAFFHKIKARKEYLQQFPLNTRSMTAVQKADPSDRDEFGALAPDEERCDGDASVIQPELGIQGELLEYLSPQICAECIRICNDGNFSSMERAQAGKTKVYLPREVPSAVIKLTGKEKAIFRIDQMKKLKQIIKKERCKQIIVPNFALYQDFLFEERIPIPKSEEECVQLYQENLDKFSDAVKEMVRIYANTYIHFLVNMGISLCDHQPTILKIRFDNICPFIDKDGAGKIALIDLERNKATDRVDHSKKLYRIANIFPNHLEEIKKEGTKLGMQYDEEKVNYGANLGSKYHRMILRRIKYLNAMSNATSDQTYSKTTSQQVDIFITDLA